jgi:predicted nucleic acid-binding protein
VSGEFVDTNIFVYAEDPTSGQKHAEAQRLIQRLIQERSGTLSTQVLAEFYLAGISKLRMPSEETAQVIRRLATWTLHRPDHASVLNCVRLHRRYRTSWWDAMIINSAIELGCSILWTEDLRHGQRIGGLTVRNPFA